MFSRVYDVADKWDYIQYVAQERLKNNKTANHIESDEDYFEVSGVMGELIVRRYLGLSEVLHTHFDGGVDIPYGKYTLDIRATNLRPYWKPSKLHLQWPKGKKLKADFVVQTFVRIDEKNGFVAGYQSKRYIMRRRINNERERPCREVPVYLLRPAYALRLLG